VENIKNIKLEARKTNLINWISTLQEEKTLKEVEKIQMQKADWWDAISVDDKNAINEGLEQLDKAESLTHAQVQLKTKERLNSIVSGQKTSK